jgi:hypothetical protein
MPTFKHRDLEFEVNDAWWEDACMAAFTPSTLSYPPGAPEKGFGLTGLEEVPLIPVDRIKPLYYRKLSHGVFNDGAEPARTRVLNLLNGFRRGNQISPLQVMRLPEGSECSHRLYHGAHRFYCSVAAGYSHVPAVEILDAH